MALVAAFLFFFTQVWKLDVRSECEQLWFPQGLWEKPLLGFVRWGDREPFCPCHLPPDPRGSSYEDSCKNSFSCNPYWGWCVVAMFVDPWTKITGAGPSPNFHLITSQRLFPHRHEFWCMRELRFPPMNFWGAIDQPATNFSTESLWDLKVVCFHSITQGTLTDTKEQSQITLGLKMTASLRCLCIFMAEIKITSETIFSKERLRVTPYD